MSKIISFVLLLFMSLSSFAQYAANWITGDETGIEKYEVMQSTDSIAWVNIGEQQPKLQTVNVYSFTIPGPGFFYKIRAVKYEDTKVKAIKATWLPGLNYSYYEASSYSVLPAFNTTPARTGISNTFDIGFVTRSTGFAVEFTGFINIAANGSFTFYTSSDDGSNLYIDDALVVKNDGLHGNAQKQGSVSLSPGKHRIKVDFFQNGGAKVLAVSYAGPGIAKQVIPAGVLFRIAN